MIRIVSIWLLWSGLAQALPAVYHLYLDADYDGARSSSVAIEEGIRTALDEINYRVGNTPVKLITRNPRGNTRRSRAPLPERVDDPQARGLYCGLHSPPVLDA